ncbi:MAG: sugar transferase [Pirellulales bacterium]|nr:sugar transferase [Pirellulales bacterium]
MPLSPPPPTETRNRHPGNVRLVRPGYQLSKRLTDLIICLASLPLVLPLLVFCALLIWLEDRGPIFFVQWRTGLAGRRFPMLKLRSMVTGAEALKDEHRASSRLTWPDFKIKKDPRVTRVGRFLRRTSLDELPQLLNVLRGDMSLVGPRPTSFAVNTYALSDTERLEVLPGLTGLWQIQGRSDIDFADRVLLDVKYIERRGFWYDVTIILRTIPCLITGRGAG